MAALSATFADRIWLVGFMHYHLGFFDHETAGSPAPRTPSPLKCYACARNSPLPIWPERTKV